MRARTVQIIVKMRAAVAVEAIYGPMFSGKTQLLIERLRAAERLGGDVVAFKPMIDDRSENEIVSLSGERYPALPVAEVGEVLRLAGAANVVGIDEAQFFEDALVDVVARLRADGGQVYVAGLDLDFLAEPFGAMPRIIEAADEAIALTAECAVCGKPASRTQRLERGKPASSGPTVLIGGRERYEPRCVAHHVV